MNGQCVQQALQLNDVKYRLVRVIGGVLGLGWSQVNPNVLTGTPPAHGDGLQNITISDPVSGASSIMSSALTFGAAASDNLVLLGTGMNPTTPAGTQATNPMHARVLAADGVTPVGGATIGWSASNGVQRSACGGASSCTVTSDATGEAITWLTPAATGVATITATLAPGVYSPSKSQSTTLNATQSASDIGVSTPYLWIAQGATVSLPLTARVVSNGMPQNNVKVNFAVISGAASVSAASAQTNSSGYASVTLTAGQFSALVKVSACVAPANAPCQIISAKPVPPASQNLRLVAGSGQVSAGAGFQPLVVQVTDSSSPANPVIAASVWFLTTVLRSGGTLAARSRGETNPTNPGMPVILQVSQSSGTTDTNGLANIVPSAGGFAAPLEVDVAVMPGSGASLDYPLQLLPSLSVEDNSGQVTPPSTVRLPVRIVRPVEIELR
jgi:hypothetical protein